MRLASTIGRAEPPQLLILKTQADIESLQTYLEQFDIIAFDTETTGITKGSLVIGMSFCAEEDKAYYIITKEWNTETKTLGSNNNDLFVTNLLISLIGKKLLAHNGLFDCSMILDNYEVSLISSLYADTMILAHLLDENRKVGLKELACEYFVDQSTEEQIEMKASIVKNGGQVTKASYELYKGDPQLIAKYGAKDALLTFKLFLQLLPTLFEEKLDTFFFEESMPLLLGPTWEMNTTGLKVDINALTQLKKTLEAECAEAKSFIYNEIQTYIKHKYPGTTKTNKFNIGASQQLSWLLFGELNLEFSTLTKSGKIACKDLGLRLPYSPPDKRRFIQKCLEASGTIRQPETKTLTKTIKAKKFKSPWAYIACDKSTLKKLAPKYKWIGKLLEYQRKTKILTTYVRGIEDKIQYGIIRPSFLQHGTTSGRYASRSPNFQNLPRDDKRVKSFVVSRPGKVFVGADYSQLEPRVFAYYSNDSRLLEAFRGEDDFYSVVGMEVYGKTDCIPRKDGSPEAFGIKYKRLRDLSKVIALASVYGATAHQLAPTTGKSLEETQQDIDNYFEQFPEVKKFMNNSHNLAKKHGYVENLFGRKRRIPDAMKINRIYGKADLPYEARSLLNLATNHRIQSTAASIVNRSAIAFYQNKTSAGIDCKLVCQVHDSLVVECNEQDADAVILLLRDAMENTIDLKTIRLEAIPKTGKNMAEV